MQYHCQHMGLVNPLKKRGQHCLKKGALYLTLQLLLDFNLPDTINSYATVPRICYGVQLAAILEAILDLCMMQSLF